MKYVLIFLSVMFFMISCKAPEPVEVIKKKPVYSKFQGKARVTSIIPSKERNGRESDSYMDIYYIFIPSEQGIIKKYNYPEFKDSGLLLNYDNRNSFHKNWIMKWGLKVGNEYPAERYEITGKVSGPHVSYDVELSPVK